MKIFANNHQITVITSLGTRLLGCKGQKCITKGKRQQFSV